MSINVLERSKEIGVMRAIGAPSSTLVGIFVVEGMIVGLLSAAIAIPFSFPVAWLFAEAVGQAMLIKMDFCYSAAGLLLWLLIVVALSSLASLWPAVRAAQLSVRETLAYE
jgi:putative ABC transport system permease protein